MIAPPTGAEAVFGPAFARAVRYAELLAGPGVERGLLGPAEAGRVWDRHLLNCAAVAEIAPPSGCLVDLGTGAGLPGLVLAMLLPELQVQLIEPLTRRVGFLNECVYELALSNVTVLRSRAEELAGRLAADAVTARAVAPLDRLAVMCRGLVRPGGQLLAMKGVSAAAELAIAQPVLSRLGVTDARVLRVCSPDGLAAATVVTVRFPQG